MKKYTPLSETTIAADPIVQFDRWYRERLEADVPLPDSVALGTASPDGKVSVRVVLLKEYNKEGFIFYTNYRSRKGSQIAMNPHAALTFHWSESGRQIRIEGTVSKVPEKVSIDYFISRPKESQISAWASEQSSVIPDRQYLDDRFNYFKKIFFRKAVAKPEDWGGYILYPDWFEFWHEREFRLHDRLTYSRQNDTWLIERLSP